MQNFTMMVLDVDLILRHVARTDILADLVVGILQNDGFLPTERRYRIYLLVKIRPQPEG